MNKNSYYLVMGIFILVGILFAGVIFMNLQVLWVEPVIFDQEKLEIINCPCKPGGTVAYHTSGHTTGVYPVKVTKTLIDGYILTYPVLHEVSGIGDFDFVSQDMKLPEFTPAGEYIIVVSLEYEINMFQSVVVQIESEPFQVVE